MLKKKRKTVSLVQVGNEYKISRFTNCLEVEILGSTYKLNEYISKTLAEKLCENPDFSVSITPNK